ncbi:acyltransferase [Aerococcaceae bacterium zg-ZUI334]|uniref:acyltransferase n=1 Tax=Aerococcaceae TaxID=186827 RepID=UPI0013B7D183|nr:MULTISPECIES: acyltransferase [unclassified Facklamia]MBR7927753.1 acyltransferase [Aerococcaceae bacterium zg-ZUI334]MBS4462092.1 acyltransferase [Aerococcaceae bacterium zg-B36]QQD65738.1 acyltransferase [Aerococcaceae bacterium zg-252]NEW64556.1 acyltransferase family protein [Facklamia sp. 252]NEW67763.1 acyltransferase family protein [Facklamia sp. 253]
MRRKYSLECIRAVAIIMVVLVHVTEGIMIIYPESKTYLLSVLFFTLGRLGVPLFLMLTGYLMLDRTDIYNDIKKYFKKYVFSLIISTWMGISVLLLYDIFKGVSYDWMNIIKMFFFLAKLPAIQTWYMPIIIGVYLILPLIAKGFQVLNSRELGMILAPVFVYSFLVTDLNQMLLMNGMKPLTVSITFDGVGSYLFYLLLGGCLKKLKEGAKRRQVYMSIVFTMTLTILVWMQYYSLNTDYIFKVWYNSALLCSASVAMFIIIEATIERKTAGQTMRKRGIVLLDRGSVFIYWLHSIILDILLNQHFFFENISHSEWTFTFAVIGYCMIIVTVCLLLKQLTKYLIKR